MARTGDGEGDAAAAGGGARCGSLRYHRRWFLRGMAASLLSLSSTPAEAGQGLSDLLGWRYLSFLNVHTSERLTVPYAQQGKVLPAAMSAVRQLLHDHHDGTLHDIDPKLLDVLYSIMRLVGGNAGSTIQVTSGYRSPHTNSVLRQMYDGVAANSYHMRGQAIDFSVPGVALTDLQRAALSVRGGGVGYYPAHNFLHVDVGPVRQWGGTGGLAVPGGGPLGHREQLMVNGRLLHLTPAQSHNLALHRRALAWDRLRRRNLGR